MPIPNDRFVPPVVSTSAEVAQIREWIAGRPVPTLDELGVVAKALAPVREKSFVGVVVGPTVALDRSTGRTTKLGAGVMEVVSTPVPTPTPARPKFSIAAPTTVAPPPRRR